jgi:hypothetical protein
MDRLTSRSEHVPGLSEALYVLLLQEARDVAFRSVERLRKLKSHFPADFSEDRFSEPLDTAGRNCNRREEFRHRGRPVRVEVRAGCVLGVWIPAWVTDCSASGIGLLVPWPVDVGLQLELRLPDSPGVATIQVRVVHCESQPGGWLAGCEMLGNRLPI